MTGSAPSEEATPPSTEALLSTLTRQQAATVRQRLDRYNQTLRSRNRQPIRDVRDVFTQVGAAPGLGAEPGEGDPGRLGERLGERQADRSRDRQ